MQCVSTSQPTENIVAPLITDCNTEMCLFFSIIFDLDTHAGCIYVCKQPVSPSVITSDIVAAHIYFHFHSPEQVKQV